jgi:predicted CXXCH cytochrome family protein
VLCHDRPAESLQGPHDPARFAPALRETLGILPSMGSCRVCHTTHDAQGPHLWARLPADTPGGPASDLCGTCHDQDTVAKPQSTHHPLSNFGLRTSDFGLKKGSDANPQSAIHNVVTPDLDPGPQLEVSCLSCHDPHKGPSPHDSRRDLCVTCHEEQLGIRGSVHDPAAGKWAKDLGFIAGNLCRDCHPIHAPKTESPLWKSLEKAPVSPDLCEACHRPGGPGPAAPTVHVGKEADFGLRPRIEVRGDKISDFGLKRADDANPQSTIRNPQSVVRCSTCHNIHQKGQSPDLLRATRRDSVSCLTCHADQSRLMDGPHDLRKSAVEVRNTRGEPVAESGPCGVCHFVHPKSTDRGTWAQPPLSGDDYGRGLCTCCHQPGGCAAGRLPENADHPEVALLNRLAPEDPAYMPLFDARGRPSPTGVISCPTCHQVHSIPAQPPAEGGPSHPMFLRTGNQTLCADCHGIEAPWRFLYYHRANRSPQRRSAPTAATIKGKREPPAFNQGKP